MTNPSINPATYAVVKKWGWIYTVSEGDTEAAKAPVEVTTRPGHPDANSSWVAVETDGEDYLMEGYDWHYMVWYPEEG